MLSHFIKLAPLIPELLGTTDIAVSATDEEKFLLWDNHANLPLDIKIGTFLKEDGTHKLAMRTGEPIHRVVPSSVHGIDFRTSCMPVEGGTIGISFSLEKRVRFMDAFQEISSSHQEVTSLTISIQNQSQNLVKGMQEIQLENNDVMESSKMITDINKVIRKTSEELDILSLNAKIEATRAGSYGKSFAVVADRVQKLANDSRENIKEIEKIIGVVSNKLNKVHLSIKDVNTNTSEQAEKINAITSYIQEVNHSMEELEKLADKL